MALKFDLPFRTDGLYWGIILYITILYVFNGLGTRGVLMAPLLSSWLYEFIDLKKELPDAVAINRFETYFCNPKKTYV